MSEVAAKHELREKELQAHIIGGTEESPEADQIRDEMETLWYQMTDQEHREADARADAFWKSHKQQA